MIGQNRKRQKVFHAGNTSIIPDFCEPVELDKLVTHTLTLYFAVEINIGLDRAGIRFLTIMNLFGFGMDVNLIKKLGSGPHWDGNKGQELQQFC